MITIPCTYIYIYRAIYKNYKMSPRDFNFLIIIFKQMQKIQYHNKKILIIIIGSCYLSLKYHIREENIKCNSRKKR